MSYDEALAARIRKCLASRTDVVEKKMFGGLCFMVGGTMCCGLTKTDFMVRVGPDRYTDALAQPHARPMDFTGRPLKGMVYVGPEGLRTASALAQWVGRGLDFASEAQLGKAPKKSARPVAGAIQTGDPQGTRKVPMMRVIGPALRVQKGARAS